METFYGWLSRLDLIRRLAENYVTFDRTQYNDLFGSELEKVIKQVRDPAHREILERMRDFDWVGYIAGMVRHAGYRDQREVQEKTHDVVVTLLVGKLFRGFDEQRSGPMDRRFRASVGNAIRNLVEKERNRRRNIPTTSISQEFTPGCATPDELPAKSVPQDDDKVIEGFRELVRRRLGDLGIAVLDTRLDGSETKCLVGSPSLGSPGKWIIKKVVSEIKILAREYAVMVGDSELLRRIERAMRAEEETVGRRQATTAARQKVAVGA
jgi:hypothetical protein